MSHNGDVTGILSVIIPCFNESETIEEVLRKVLNQPIVGQVIVINDASTDDSAAAISRVNDTRLEVYTLNKNVGKGNALSLGIMKSTKCFLIIQDADLEYDPSQYVQIIQPLIDGLADVVYGSRFLTGGPRRVLYFWHRVGNSLLTLLSNVVTNLDLSDMETCYKAMRTDIAKSIKLKEKRFGIEPEITAKLARRKFRIFEVAISYNGRTYKEGKKINLMDAFSAVPRISVG